MFALWKGIQISESGKILPAASGILGFGIQNTAQGIWKSTNDKYPESNFHWRRLESSTWNPESTGWNLESKTAEGTESLSGTSKPWVRINEIVTENDVVGHEASIANELNKYFVNILEQICKDNKADVEFGNSKLTNFICSRLNSDTFYKIPSLTPKQTIGIIEKISSNKASQYHGISVRVLKKIATVLQIHYADYLTFQYRPTVFLRDGPLEKLWGGGGEFSSRTNFFSLPNSLYEFF